MAKPITGVPSDSSSPDAVSLPLEATLSRLSRMIRAAGARFGVADDEVDALMQEVRIRLWRAHPDGEEIGQLPTSYVYRTAMTAAVDLVRTRRRHAEREPPLESATPESITTAATTDARVFASDLGAAIERALISMGEARRVVVRMHLAGYDRPEMSRLTGWSDAKVRNLLYRGLQDLREQLERAGYRWPDET